jgi:hypothetical protein
VPAYAFAGLRLDSEFELAGLDNAPGAGVDRSDVTVRFGRIPDWLADTPSARRPHHAPDDLVGFTPTARYRMHLGREIVVEELSPTAEAQHAIVVLGTCLTGVCIQRGMPTLHASTVLAPAGAVALAGPSGAGKSTLAAHLDRAGHPLLADDLTVLEAPGHGPPVVRSGIRRTRLLHDAVVTLGSTGHPTVVTAHGTKWALPAASHHVPGRAPLAALVVIQRGHRSGFEQVRARERAAMIPYLLHRPRRALNARHRTTTAAALLQVLDRIEVWRLIRAPAEPPPVTIGTMGPLLERLAGHGAGPRIDGAR